MFIMFFILGEYQNIIDKCHHELVQIFHEYFVHGMGVVASPVPVATMIFLYIASSSSPE
jgi:hypothetical protein